MKCLFLKYHEVIAYLFWGVMTTLVNWATYAGLKHAFPEGVFLQNAAAWCVSVAVAFVVNKVRVFGSGSWEISLVWRELVKFVLSRAATGAIEIFGIPLLVRIGFDASLSGMTARIFSLPEGLITEGMISKIIISIIVVILNYVFSKLIVFRGAENRVH